MVRSPVQVIDGCEVCCGDLAQQGSAMSQVSRGNALGSHKSSTVTLHAGFYHAAYTLEVAVPTVSRKNDGFVVDDLLLFHPVQSGLGNQSVTCYRAGSLAQMSATMSMTSCTGSWSRSGGEREARKHAPPPPPPTPGPPSGPSIRLAPTLSHPPPTVYPPPLLPRAQLPPHPRSCLCFLVASKTF